MTASTTPPPPDRYLDAARYRTRDDMLRVKSMIRSLPAYAASTGELNLTDFRDIIREADAALTAHVVTLVQDQHWSWSQIADELGCSRPAAMRRYSHLVTSHRARGGQPVGVR